MNLFNYYIENEKDFIDLELGNKNTRINFGDKAEAFVYNDLISKGINVKSVKEFKNYTRKFDLEYGDLYFPDTKKYIDVKMGKGLSKASLNNFKGEGYLFAIGIPPTGGNVTANKIWYIKASVLRGIRDNGYNSNIVENHLDAKKMDDIIVYAKMPSKEEGFYFNFNLIKEKISYSSIIEKKLKK